MTLKEIKFRLLDQSIKILCSLKYHKDSFLARIGFYCFRFLLELLSNSRVLYIISADEYAIDQGCNVTPLVKNRKGYVANAVSIGFSRGQTIEERPLPDLNLYSFKNACIHYGSDFVVFPKQRLIINDYCAHLDDSNKGYQDSLVHVQAERIAIIKAIKPKRRLKAGIMINGKFPFNYYHNLYENLIRLLLIRDFNHSIPQDVPIVLDEDVFNIPSLKKIYQILSSPLNRETIVLKKGESVFVDSLYSVTAINSLVPIHKDYMKGRIDDYVFDKEYTLKLRDSLLGCIDNKQVFPERFFISRKNMSHRKFNEDELFEVLRPYGFVKIAPEEYPFEQQIALFHNAKWIFGSPGAALTNLLFLSESSIAICLYRDSTYIPPIFTAPVCFINAHLFYFQSNNVDSGLKVHSDFTISVDQFKHFVDECIVPDLN